MPKSLRLRRCLNTCLALFLSAAFASGPAQLAVEASTPRQLVSESLRGLDNHTNQLVKQVQFFLQASGRWAPAPQGQDMQLCQALQTFQQTVGRLKNDNESRPYNVVQSDFQLLQMQSQNVEQLLGVRASSPMVSAAWMQVRNDLAYVNQALYPVLYLSADNFYDSESGPVGGSSGSTFQPGFPGSASPFRHGRHFDDQSYYPGSHRTDVYVRENSTFDVDPDSQGFWPAAPRSPFLPGTTGTINPDKSQILSNLRSAEEDTERFVKKLTGFFVMRGGWPPPQGTPQMQLCQYMQSFQQQCRKLESDLDSSVSFSVLQNEMNQIAATSQNIDQLLRQINAGPDIFAGWNQVRVGMDRAYQGLYPAASRSGSFWTR
jgi:hypothetical protein